MTIAYLVWFLFASFLLGSLLLFLNEIKSKDKKLRKKIISNWGKPKSDGIQELDQIKTYFTHKKKESNHFQYISDRVFSDLNMSAVFLFLDRTSSHIGQQYLYFRLRTIERIPNLKIFHKLSLYFLTHKEERTETQIQLSRLKSYALENLIFQQKTINSRFLKWAYLLSFTSVLLLVIGVFINKAAFLFLAPIFMINLIMHYRNKSDVDFFLNGIHQLSLGLHVIKKIFRNKSIRNHFSEIDFIPQLESMSRWIKVVAINKSLNNEYLILVWYVLEVIKIQFNIEYILFSNFMNSVQKEKKNIEKLFEYIGKIDSAISMASIMDGEKNICQPIFSTTTEIKAKDLTHPLISNCTPNSLEVPKGHSLILTGSNMSGKTTFIRTFALNLITAETFFICFAKSFEVPFYKTFTSIHTLDNLLEGKSFFLQEVLTIREMIKHANDRTPNLFILDELFKGTNTIERIAAGKAVLSYLNNDNNFIMISTHDIELVNLLKDEKFIFYHFSESIQSRKVVFDYKLKSGVLKTKNAINILKIYDFPKEIIIDALETSKKILPSSTESKEQY